MQGLGTWPLRSVHNLRAASFPPSSKAAGPSTTATTSAPDHVTFIQDVAGLEPQPYLPSLLNVLQAKGESACSPYAKRKGSFPLAIPLAENPSDGSLTALLRWPTPAKGMDVPVVAVHKLGVTLLAKSMGDYIHRAMVEDEGFSDGQEDRVYSMAGDIGQKLYDRGQFLASKEGSVDVYLLKKVGKFPDVFERLALNHLAKGDEISALVTGEFYSGRQFFPGFGRPFVFNAELLFKVGRKLEAKDAARIALKSPWWTLGSSYEGVAEIAGCEDELLEFTRERLTEKGRREDLLKGKTAGQVALDQAAFLLDLAAVDGSWDEVREELASSYNQAGMDDVSRFILTTSP